jgi:hypothetical protein
MPFCATTVTPMTACSPPHRAWVGSPPTTFSLPARLSHSLRSCRAFSLPSIRPIRCHVIHQTSQRREKVLHAPAADPQPVQHHRGSLERVRMPCLAHSGGIDPVRPPTARALTSLGVESIVFRVAQRLPAVLSVGGEAPSIAILVGARSGASITVGSTWGMFTRRGINYPPVRLIDSGVFILTRVSPYVKQSHNQEGLDKTPS